MANQNPHPSVLGACLARSIQGGVDPDFLESCQEPLDGIRMPPQLNLHPHVVSLLQDGSTQEFVVTHGTFLGHLPAGFPEFR